MGLPSYIVNFDELSELIKDYLENGVNVDIENLAFNTDNLEKMLESIKDKVQGVNYENLISALNNLGLKLDGLSSSLGIIGKQKIYGNMLEIPAITGQNIVSFLVPKQGRITGITYSLSAWNFQDDWNLVVNDDVLFSKVTTKEFGEHKYLNSFYLVKGGDTIQFIFNNNSGASKVLWADFNILEG